MFEPNMGCQVVLRRPLLLDAIDEMCCLLVSYLATSRSLLHQWFITGEGGQRGPACSKTCDSCLAALEIATMWGPLQTVPDPRSAFPSPRSQKHLPPIGHSCFVERGLCHFLSFSHCYYKTVHLLEQKVVVWSFPFCLSLSFCLFGHSITIGENLLHCVHKMFTKLLMDILYNFVLPKISVASHKGGAPKPKTCRVQNPRTHVRSLLQPNLELVISQFYAAGLEVWEGQEHSQFAWLWSTCNGH